MERSKGEKLANSIVFRWIAIMLLLALAACNSPHSDIDFKEEAQKEHSLPKLLLLYDEEYESHSKSLYFVRPIGRFGQEGLNAAIDHVVKNDRSLDSTYSLALIFGVATAAKVETGYDICGDQEMKQRLTELSASSGRSFFLPTLKDICDASAISDSSAT